MKIGYSRVSTSDQNLDLQIDALKQQGCEIIYQEKISGKNTKDRPEFQKMMASLREGDTLVIWDITRLGRSVIDLISIVTTLKERGVGFIAIRNSMDTTTPSGMLLYTIMAALAEYERVMISERTKAGLTAAKQRGRLGGRPTGLTAGAKKKASALKVLVENGTPTAEACKIMGVSRATGYRYIGLEI